MQMSNEQVRCLAPAAFATAPSGNMSERYAFVDTMQIAAIMQEHDFNIVIAKQDRSRRRDPQFQRHSLTFRQGTEQKVVGDYVHQLIIENSHNGTFSLRMHMGVFRLVCSNGMVVGTAALDLKMRHTGNLAEDVSDLIQKSLAHTENVDASIDHWSSIQLEAPRQEAFAQQAGELRFGKAAAASYKPDALLEAHRPEDEGNDLWHVFNRVQENTTMRQIAGRSALNRPIRSRPLISLNNLAYNAALWRLADSMATAQ